MAAKVEDGERGPWDADSTLRLKAVLEMVPTMRPGAASGTLGGNLWSSFRGRVISHMNIAATNGGGEDWATWFDGGRRRAVVSVDDVGAVTVSVYERSGQFCGEFMKPAGERRWFDEEGMPMGPGTALGL